jgi:transposase
MSSIIEQSTGAIVKSDYSGRTRYAAKYKQEVVAAFESSSLSAPAFARQCGIKYPTFKAAHGIELTRNLMCSWHDLLADRLLPLYKLIGARIRQSHYIKVDETPVRCLQPGTGKTAPGYFWVYHHDEHGVLFDWHNGRADTCLDNILIGGDGKSSFSGYLQSDGLRAYGTFIKRHPEQSITPVSCLAHISRKFKEARNEHPRIAARILLLIGMIYQVEKRIDTQNAQPLDRQRARWLESRKP